MSTKGHLLIRPEQPGDEEAIEAVTTAAFGQDDEANIVAALRATGALTISLVAAQDKRLVGHIAFSPVAVLGDPAWSALALGPLSVLPGAQRHGMGGRLVRLGLAHCLARDDAVVFLLGHPEYYPRFGFRPAPALGLTCKWAESGDHFMVAELRPAALAGRTGFVQFAAAFA